MRRSLSNFSYQLLEPGERFRLILAAHDRRDDIERERLRGTSPEMTVSTSDHMPWSMAFDELATAVFLDLLEAIAQQDDALRFWCDTDDADVIEDAAGSAGNEPVSDEETPSVDDDDLDSAEDDAANMDAFERTASIRAMDLYLAHGFTVKTKLDGWLLFCQRQNVPPFVAWQALPGFRRIEHAISAFGDGTSMPAAAFTAEGMLQWLTKIKSADGTPPTAASIVTPEGLADELDDLFCSRVEWWGGSV